MDHQKILLMFLKYRKICFKSNKKIFKNYRKFEMLDGDKKISIEP